MAQHLCARDITTYRLNGPRGQFIDNGCDNDNDNENVLIFFKFKKLQFTFFVKRVDGPVQFEKKKEKFKAFIFQGLNIFWWVING